MKVVLCQPASRYIHSALAPWYLKAAAKKRCRAPHTVTVAEATVNQSPEAAARRLCAEEPALIGLSCYIWNIRWVGELLPLLRRLLPHCRIVLGGPEVTFRPENALKTLPEADFVLCGEGELSFPALLDALEENAPLDRVPGLCRRTGKGILCAPPPAPVTRLDDPYDAAYFEALAGRISYIETTRGCPFSCAYCLSGRTDRLRCFPLEDCFGRLLRLAQSGSQTIKFVDRTFNADEKRAMAIWRFLADAKAAGQIPEGVCFHFEVAADLFSDECLAFLAQMPKGLFQFEAGLQSFHAPTLAAVQRKTDPDRICFVLERLLAAGNIHLHIDLIAGLPHEDLSTFAESFDRAFAIGAHQLQLGFLKLIHGSTLRAEAEKYGIEWEEAPPYQVTRTHRLSPADLARLEQVETALGRLSNSGRYARSLPYLLSLWQGGAFSFFSAFAACSRQLGDRPSADGVAEAFYRFGCGVAGVKADRLRDLLALDLLASQRRGRLPDFLKVPDPRLKAVNIALRQKTARCPGGCFEKFTAGLLSFCILYSSAGLCGGAPTLALFDYTAPDPVTRQYPAALFDLGEFLPQAES